MLSNYHYESAIMKNARILDMEDTTELLIAANILSVGLFQSLERANCSILSLEIDERRLCRENGS